MIRSSSYEYPLPQPCCTQRHTIARAAIPQDCHDNVLQVHVTQTIRRQNPPVMARTVAARAALCSYLSL